MGVTLGGLVGYTIRFEYMSGPQTHIKYMTDGILVRECMEDPLLRRYAVVILDEAHERSLETDILFCLLKRAVRARPDLKLVIMSATLDAGRFSAYFDNCPVFMIPGRAFEVEVYHNSELDVTDLRNKYVQYAFDTVMYIHKQDILGDVLVFLTGRGWACVRCGWADRTCVSACGLGMRACVRGGWAGWVRALAVGDSGWRSVLTRLHALTPTPPHSYM